MRKHYDFSDGVMITPPPNPDKIRVTMLYDLEVIDWFREQVHKAGGGSYTDLINNVLRKYVTKKKNQGKS